MTLGEIDPLGLFFIGAMFIVCSIAMGIKGFKFIVSAGTTTGTIIRLNSTSSTHGPGRVYAPVVEYKVNGKRYVHVSPTYNKHYANSTGKTISVHYSPKDPSYVYIGKKAKFFYFELIFLFIGVSVMGIAIYNHL